MQMGRGRADQNAVQNLRDQLDKVLSENMNLQAKLDLAEQDVVNTHAHSRSLSIRVFAGSFAATFPLRSLEEPVVRKAVWLFCAQKIKMVILID